MKQTKERHSQNFGEYMHTISTPPADTFMRPKTVDKQSREMRDASRRRNLPRQTTGLLKREITTLPPLTKTTPPSSTADSETSLVLKFAKARNSLKHTGAEPCPNLYGDKAPPLRALALVDFELRARGPPPTKSIAQASSQARTWRIKEAAKTFQM